jgi:DNA-binding NarL/FixJ family response regulator
MRENCGCGPQCLTHRRLLPIRFGYGEKCDHHITRWRGPVSDRPLSIGTDVTTVVQLSPIAVQELHQDLSPLLEPQARVKIRQDRYSPMVRLFIADKHPIIRQGIKRGLADVEVVGEASTAEELLHRLPKHACDVLLLDLVFPHQNGLTLIPTIRAWCPFVRIIVFSMFNEPRYARQALDLGAAGYVVKTASMAELRTAVQRVLAGQTYLSQPLEEDDIHTRRRSVRTLSPREEQILQLIASGQRIRDIAELLGISVKTIKSHQANIREKLYLSSSSALLNYAVTDRLRRER